MNKRLYFIGFVCSLLLSCGKQNVCQINGIADDIADSTRLYLVLFNDMKGTTMDSTVVHGGKFTFRIMIDSLTGNYPLLVSNTALYDKESVTVTLYAEAGAKLDMKYSADAKKRKVSGSPLNDIQQDYERQQAVIADKIVEANKKSHDETLTEEQRVEYKKLAGDAYQEMVRFEQEFSLEQQGDRYYILFSRNGQLISLPFYSDVIIKNGDKDSICTSAGNKIDYYIFEQEKEHLPDVLEFDAVTANGYKYHAQKSGTHYIATYILNNKQYSLDLGYFDRYAAKMQDLIEFKSSALVDLDITDKLFSEV